MMKTMLHIRHTLTTLVILITCFSYSISQTDGLRVNSTPFQTIVNNVEILHLVNTDIEPLAAIDSLNQVVFVSRYNFVPNSGHHYTQSVDAGQSWILPLGPISSTSAPFVRGMSILLSGDPSNNPELTRMDWLGNSNNYNNLLYGGPQLPLSGTPASIQSALSFGNTHYLTSGIGRAQFGQHFTVMTSIDPITSEPDSLKLLANVPASAAPITPWIEVGGWDIVDSIPFITPKIAFSPDGNTGWIVALSDIIGQGQDSSLTPVYWKTLDGGLTWAGPEEVDFSNWQCLNDSLATASLPVVPSTSFEFDLTVDNNGNPHILTAMMIRQPGTEYSVLAGARKWVVDITTPDKGTTWQGLMIDHLHTFRGELIAQPANFTFDNTFQIGRNPAGDRIFYSWEDTDTILYVLSGVTDNISPDLMTAAFSTFDSSSAGKVNWTFNSLNLSGTVMFHHMAPEVLFDTTGADTHLLPITYVRPVTQTFGEVIYLSDIHIPEADFDTTFLLVGDNTCGTVCSNAMCVWPGDAAYDFMVDMDDLLMLGTNFDSLGPPRANASNNWTSQPGTLWADSTAGVNMMHSDCDGNGHTFWSDTIAIQQNYSLTHNKTSGPQDDLEISGAPTLTLVPLFDSLQVGQAGTIAIQLGDSLLPADSIYGLRFTFNYDPALIDTNSVHVSFQSSWMGTPNLNMIGLYQDMYYQGQTDIGMVGTDQLERQGYGTIASVSIVAIDNISAKRLIEVDTLNFGLSKIRVIGIDQLERTVGSQGGSAIVWDTETGVTSPTEALEPNFKIWPNPAQSEIFIDWEGSSKVEIKIIDQLGRVVFAHPTTSTKQIRIDATQLPAGLYYLNMGFDEHKKTQRLIIQQ